MTRAPITQHRGSCSTTWALGGWSLTQYDTSKEILRLYSDEGLGEPVLVFVRGDGGLRISGEGQGPPGGDIVLPSEAVQLLFHVLKPL